MPRGRGKARSIGVGRGGNPKVSRNESIESVQCPLVEQEVPTQQAPVEQPPTEQAPVEQPTTEQAPVEQPPTEQAPIVDHSPSDMADEEHLESEEPTLTDMQQDNVYIQLNFQPRKSPDGRIYLEPYNNLYHPHSAIRQLSNIIQKYFHGPWAWNATPNDVKDRWFGELKEAMIGREVRPSELFLITHKSKGSGNFVDKKSKTVWEKFESEMKESNGDTSRDGENVNVQPYVTTTTEQEVSVWNKVVGGPTKGRIYGFGLEGSIFSGQIALSIPSQGSSHMPNISEDSVEQMEVMHQEAEKAAQERQEMQKELQDLRALVNQLLAKTGMTPPCSDQTASGSNLP